MEGGGGDEGVKQVSQPKPLANPWDQWFTQYTYRRANHTRNIRYCSSTRCINWLKSHIAVDIRKVGRDSISGDEAASEHLL